MPATVVNFGDFCQFSVCCNYRDTLAFSCKILKNEKTIEIKSENEGKFCPAFTDLINNVSTKVFAIFGSPTRFSNIFGASLVVC